MAGIPKDKVEGVVDALVWKYPTWFFEILVQMNNKPLILEPFQIRYLLDDSQFKITNKTRQAGGSVQLALAKFFKAYTRQNYRCDIVSISLTEAADKITKIKAFWETIPKRYQLPLEIDNALSIGFHKGKSNMSVINSRAASGSIRGASKDIVFDEFAHIREAEGLFDAALPAIMNGELGVDIVSTPQGRHNMFAHIWLNEENERGVRPFDIFSRHEFIWLDVPRFTKDFAEVQWLWNTPKEFGGCGHDMKMMPELIETYASDTLKAIYGMRPMDYILQEYCGAFLDDTFALFPYELLNKVFKPTVRQIEDQEEKEVCEPWSDISGRPEGNDSFVVIGVDFGKSGGSTDKTSIQVLEKRSDRLYHRFSKNLTRSEFVDFPAQAAEVSRIANVFRADKIVCDATGLGLGVVPLIKRMLPNRHVEGIEFSQTNKSEMVMNLKSLMERDKIWLMQTEQQLFDEIHDMRGDPTPTGKIRYHGEPHDDMFWALALAANEGTYTHFAMYTIEQLIKGAVDGRPYSSY